MNRLISELDRFRSRQALSGRENTANNEAEKNRNNSAVPPG